MNGRQILAVLYVGILAWCLIIAGCVAVVAH